MSPEEFRRVFPLVRDWIEQTLAASAARAKPVAAFDFPRLREFYEEALLAQTNVVFVDRCPVPPLSKFGLTQFTDFEQMNAAGITYLNTYFVLWPLAERESLHFHELVHVLQWRLLGAERFLALYADGLERCGYRNSPLEVMAYEHEGRFRARERPYSVEDAVRRQLASLKAR